MSINGLSFMSARPTPQPCVSVHRCGVFEKYCYQGYIFILFCWQHEENSELCKNSPFYGIRSENLSKMLRTFKYKNKHVLIGMRFFWSKHWSSFFRGREGRNSCRKTRNDKTLYLFTKLTSLFFLVTQLLEHLFCVPDAWVSTPPVGLMARKYKKYRNCSL